MSTEFHSQTQSPLLRLPAELRNMIYYYCLVSTEPITDAAFSSRNASLSLSPSPYRSTPPLGTSIMSTCRKCFDEADIRPLFEQNTFCFTNAARMQSFLTGIGKYANLINDIAINVRAVTLNDALHTTELGSLQSWNYYRTVQLKADVSSLKTLRLNFEHWPRINMTRRNLWELLRRLLRGITGLERVIVTGASKGNWMGLQDPWNPAHYVGTRDVGPRDLVELMSSAISGPVEDRYIRWSRGDGSITLEAFSVPPAAVPPPLVSSSSLILPSSGCTSWIDYTVRRDSKRRT